MLLCVVSDENTLKEIPFRYVNLSVTYFYNQFALSHNHNSYIQFSLQES